MPQDRYYGTPVGLSDPANEAVAIVPNDTTTLTDIRSVRVGGGGTLVMQGLDDSTPHTWTNVADGETIPFRPAKILATGTTCTNILGYR